MTVGAAIILATARDASGTPAALLRIGGETLLERHGRTLLLAGVREICVVHAPGTIPERHLGGLRGLGLTVHGIALRASRIDQSALPPALRQCEILVTDASLLLDRRFPKLLAARGGEGVCLLPAASLAPLDRERLGTLPLPGEARVFSGCALLRADSVAGLDLSDRRAFSAGAATLVGKDPGLAVDLPATPPYDPDQKARIPWMLLAANDSEDDPRGTRLLLAAARKETLDWPALYIHRPVEDWIVARICRWPVTPNQLTFATNALAFPAAWLFASGRFGAGLALALVVGILDGLDGKQARVKLIFSPMGHWEHFLDKLYENAWWVGIAWHLAETSGRWAWIALAIFVGSNLLDLAVAGAFRARWGVQLDDAGPFERRFRLVAGRRNTYIWTFAPFVLSGARAAGFAVLAGYAAISLTIRCWRAIAARPAPRAPR